MVDEATPGTAPSIDSVIDTIVREDDAREQVETQAPVATEPEEPQAPDPEPEAPEPEAEPTYTVKVRGAEVKVTLDELQRGYSRTEDYKAKTAELAEQRRAAEQTKAEFAARAQRLDEALSQAPFDPVLAEGMKTDWQALARENPAEYVARRAEFDGKIQRVQQLQQMREDAARQSAQQRLAESDARMREAVPEWADEGKRKALQSDLARTLEGYGFAPDEFRHVADHRVLLVARDAMLYHQMQDQRKAAEAKKATPTPPRTVTPGAPQGKTTSPEVKALINKAKSGRTEDQVAAALALLG
jgi:hypothetical protein